MQTCKQAHYLALAECGAVVNLVASGTLTHGLPATVDTGLLQEGQTSISVTAGTSLHGSSHDEETVGTPLWTVSIPVSFSCTELASPFV